MFYDVGYFYNWINIWDILFDILNVKLKLFNSYMIMNIICL